MAKKYIDTELLKVEINKHYDDYKTKFHQYGESYYLGLIDGIDMTKRIIDSLQQEQPCDTCTNDKGCVTCKDGELWEGKEQPCEDLKAEIEMEWDSFNKHLAKYGEESEEVVWLNWYSFEDIARHFYELGKNSK